MITPLYSGRDKMSGKIMVRKHEIGGWSMWPRVKMDQVVRHLEP